MKEFKGTPGQWTCEVESINSITIVDDNEKIVCEVIADNSEDLLADIEWSNARLIASAPDLLFALQEITAHLDSIKQYSNDDYYINQAQLAITKALGE